YIHFALLIGSLKFLEYKIKEEVRGTIKDYRNWNLGKLEFKDKALTRLSVQFEELITKPNTLEGEIDKFLSANPIILEITLKIVKLQYQPELKDVHLEIGQDL